MMCVCVFGCGGVAGFVGVVGAHTVAGVGGGMGRGVGGE